MKTFKIRDKKNKNDISLYLETYENGKRTRTTLPFKKPIGKDPLSKQLAKEVELAADKYLHDKKTEYFNGINNINTPSKIMVKDYVSTHLSKYHKKDKRNVQGVCNKFIELLRSLNIEQLKMTEIKEIHIIELKNYLLKNHKGEGPASYFARFKKVLKNAEREGIITQDPSKYITINRDSSLRKDVLTDDEIKKLYKTTTSNTQVKNAFIFCLYTGLRWVDIKDLKYKDLDYENHRMNLIQSKTGKKLNVAVKKELFDIILPKRGERDLLVFNLPSLNSANKTLKYWCKRAGIDKHITWHCGRHTFATIVNINGTDHFTIQKMMGLTSTKYLGRYTTVPDELQLRHNDKRQSLLS